MPTCPIFQIVVYEVDYVIIQQVSEFIVKLAVYTMFLSGLWLLVKPYLKTPVIYLLKGARNNSGLKFLKSGFLPQVLADSRIYHHCSLLLQSTWKYYSKASVANFFILSIGLLLSSLAIYYRLTHSWLVTAIASIFTFLLPYASLRIVLQFMRTNTSYQLGPAVGMLLAGYRVSSKNIYFAILHTINKLEDTSLKSAFLVLANHIQSHKNRNDIEHAVELFVFKIQTSWAKQLGILLLNALVDGCEIERSLSNIVNDMKEGQKIIEQEKSNAHETILLGYFPLIALPLTILFMTKLSGQFNILFYQFKTPQGLTSFIITSIFCLSGFLLALFFRKPKNDL